ncbi:unnamed protein product [Closterium sp. Yama58-4]|nr:unnamed protein product [Closterium sp. Yama58-4]
MLRLPAKQFWKTVARSPSLVAFLDSYLRFRSRWFDHLLSAAADGGKSRTSGHLRNHASVFPSVRLCNPLPSHRTTVFLQRFLLSLALLCSRSPLILFLLLCATIRSSNIESRAKPSEQLQAKDHARTVGTAVFGRATVALTHSLPFRPLLHPPPPRPASLLSFLQADLLLSMRLFDAPKLMDVAAVFGKANSFSLPPPLFPPLLFSDLLLSMRLFDAPKLMDVAAVFGKANSFSLPPPLFPPLLFSDLLLSMRLFDAPKLMDVASVFGKANSFSLPPPLFPPLLFSDLLLSMRLFDAPKLMDVAAVFGKANSFSLPPPLFPPLLFSDLLLSMLLFDVPKLMDVAAVFGKANPVATRQLVCRVLVSQPLFRADLSSSLLQLLRVVEEMVTRACGQMEEHSKATSDAAESKPSPSTEILEALHYLCDFAFSLDALFDAYPPAPLLLLQATTATTPTRKAKQGAAAAAAAAASSPVRLLSVLARIHDSFLPLLSAERTLMQAAATVNVQGKVLQTKLEEVAWKGKHSGCPLWDGMLGQKTNLGQLLLEEILAVHGVSSGSSGSKDVDGAAWIPLLRAVDASFGLRSAIYEEKMKGG